MPKIPTPLTDTKISNSKPKTKEYTLSDGQGLHLLIKVNGSKIWEFVYVSPTLKKRRKKSLGIYPTISLSKARELRANLKQTISNNIDPIEQEKNIKNEEQINNKGLFQNVMEEWFIRQKKTLEKVTYDRKYNLFLNYVLPRFKDRNIKDITKLELLKLLEDKEKTAKETASRLFNYLQNLWAFAVLKDYCEYNYLANINKNDVLVEKRVRNNYAKITDEDIFKELVNKVYGYNGSISIKNALKFVLHIPLRAYNLCFLKWEYIDFENKILTIPRNLMKVKNHNLQDFMLPLTDEVINILNEQKEFSSRYTNLKEFIFIGTDNISPINRESPNQALIRLGFTAEKKQSLHSFRGSFRTITEEKQDIHKIDTRIIESVLDHHKEGKVELSYKNRIVYLERQKPLMNWWSNYILNLKY
ncbi:site-specific tyrosine recombinase, phage integrase family (INT_P4_C, DUF4102 domains) [Aliarcobacter faecis]|uniref:tyrosine-type recombinase/integrase n=1 Tax=Aliarcobacter faecis TaxID=1564138 RepID=UPI00047CA269|nr:integrase arm-type DNA-binding domain-containing protein [Aliarcobacter faecis]QKF72801.1 site-specific tyrosine recombinase, phage integrase family (INT_P4_C, DUF4102 domains) [Aliarcobacter faecis]